MRAGQLRHVLEIQTNAQATNSVGERIDDWITETTRRGKVKPLQGREFYEARQVKADVTHTGTIRYYPLTPEHRIKLGTRIFPIEAVMHDDGRKIETTFLCRESV